MYGSNKILKNYALFASILLVQILRKVRQLCGGLAVSFVDSVTALFNKSMKGRLAFIILAAFLQTVAYSSSSQAGFILTLDDPSTAGIDAVIADNSSADGHPAFGIIQFAGIPSTVWSINFTTGLSKPILFDPATPNVVKLDLFSIMVSSDGPGTLEIMLTDTDYTLPESDHWVLTHHLGGTTNGTVTVDSFIDLGNAEFGMGATPGTLGPFGPGAFSDTAGLQIDDPVSSNPFSMTQKATIVHTDAFQITSFDSELVATANEPGTLAVFGIGLIGLGYSRLRRSTVLKFDQ